MSDIVSRHTEEKMMKANVDDEKWSTLEKKYIFKDQQDQSNERPKGKLATLRLGHLMLVVTVYGLFCDPFNIFKMLIKNPYLLCNSE